MPSRRRFGILVLLVCMEVLAGFAVIVGSSLLDAISLQYAMFWVLLGSALAGLLTALITIQLGSRSRKSRLVLLCGGVLAAAGPAFLVADTVVAFLVSTFLLGLLYWRGVVAASDEIGYDDVRRRFGWGFGFLFFGFLWVTGRGILYQRPIWQMLAFVGIGYTISAMLALGTSRLEETREPGAGRAVALAVGLQLLLIGAIGLLALQIFSLDIVSALWRLTRGGFDALGSFLYQFVLLLVTPVQDFISLIRPHNPRHPSTVSPPPPLAPPNAQHKKLHTNGSPAVAIGALIVALLVLSGVGWLIWRSVPRLPRKRPDRGFVEERRSLWSLRETWELLLVWLKALFRKGAGAAREAVRRSRRRLFGEYPDDPVRRAYAQLLRRAEAAGLPRPAGATPTEFQSRLAARWPDGSHHFSVLTNAYILRRYGDVAFTDEQVTRLREHWQHVRLMMRLPRRRREPAPAAGVEPAAAGVEEAREGGPARWLSTVRRFVHLPEVRIEGEQSGARSTILVTLLSFVLPIIILLVMLVFLAILNNAGGHHSLPALPFAVFR